MNRFLTAAAFGLALTSFAPLASASPESDAKDLFQRARDYRTAGDCASAAPLFGKAWKLYPEGLGSLRNFAECEEQIGHFASSRRSWLDLKRALITRPADPKYAGWDTDAETAAARLKPKVATFVVDVFLKTPESDGPANDQSGVELLVNGESIGTALVGTPLERDPGNYIIRARTEGAAVVEQRVTINAGDNPHVTLRLTRTTSLKTASQTTTTTVPAKDPNDHPGRRTAGIVVASVGAAALAGSLVTFLVRNSAKSDVDRQCIRGVCPDGLQDTVDRGKTMTTLTNILFPVGIVGVVGGAALIITSKSWGKKPAASATEVRITPSLGGLGVSGRF